MSRAISPSANRPYGVVMVTQEWGIPRSTYYEQLERRASLPPAPKKRGPKTSLSDDDLVTKIREVLSEAEFVGEGYRKVWARLRHRKNVRTSKSRVLRLMRAHRLQAPPRARRNLGPRVHDGTITTDRPNVMWGIDATSTFTLRQGLVSVFFAVDHCTGECVGIHAAPKGGTRFDAIEVVRQGVRGQFNGYDRGLAAGLSIRHDHGTQFVADAFQKELRFVGAVSSPSFVRAPEGNGVAERFGRTLKEQLLWLETFEDVESLRRALVAWAKLYNEQWLVARHGYRSPAQIRRDLLAIAEAA
jgi:transposase InsO family protein